MISGFSLYVLILCSIAGVSAVLLKRAGYLRRALQGGAALLSVLLAAGFVYGQFNGFRLGHGYADPGSEAGLAYAFILGIAIGPPVFVLGALITAAIVHFRRSKEAAR